MVAPHLLVCENDDIQYVGRSTKTTDNDGEASMIGQVGALDIAKAADKVTLINHFFNPF